jgi:hypothetical protein
MRRSTRSAILCAAAAATFLTTHQAFAASYASGVTESAGTISFTLNEDAQNVIILRDGVPTSLGAQARGTLSFTRDGATNWQIQVVQSGGLGFGTALPSFATSNTELTPRVGVLQAQPDSALTRFNSPRGIDVNTSTADLSLFGRVYVSNSPTAAGTTASAALTPGVGSQLPARGATGKGLYVLDGKLAEIPGVSQGDNAITPAGISWDPSTTSTASPYRVTVGPDGTVYVTDWSDANGTLFYSNPNLTAGGNLFAGVGSGPNVVSSPALNHGSVAGVAVTGNLGSNLTVWTVDEDLKQPGAADHTQDNSVWRYDVGSTVGGYSGDPTYLATYGINFVSQVADIDRAPDGKLFVTDYRANGTDEPGLSVVAEDGTILWDSLTKTTELGLDTADVLRQTYGGVAVSKDGKWVALARVDNSVWVLPIDPTTGLPDITQRKLFNGLGATGNSRGIAFDAAGNLFMVSSGYQAMRVFSPGGTSITTLSSDGSFTTQSAATPEWLATGSASANDAANWPLSVAPNNSGAFVKFGSAITAPSTVTLVAPTTYGSIILDNPTNSYTLSGAALTINTPSFQTPQVYVNGNHTIASPTTIARTTTATVNPGSTLTLSGGLSGAGGLTVNSGNSTTGGNVDITAPANIGALSVRTNSTVKLSGSNATASKFTGLSTFTSATAGTPPVTTNTFVGTLDLTDSKVVVNYASTTTNASETLRLQLLEAYQSGAWTGKGITSSLAAADAQKIHSLGYVEANDKLGAAGTWFGQSTDAHALLLAYTFAGDADLDLAIDPDDYALLDEGYALTQAGTLAAGAARWSNGDFDYNGTINTGDYLILDTTKGKLAGLAPELLSLRESQFGSDYVASLVAAVPEPTSLGLVAAAGALASTRRRRTR